MIKECLSGAMGSPSAQVVRTSTGARRMRDLSVTSFQAMEILWSNLFKLSKYKDPCKNMISIKSSNFVNGEEDGKFSVDEERMGKKNKE